MQLKNIRFFLLILLLITFSNFTWSQIEQGGTPRSFSYPSLFSKDSTLHIPSPDRGKINSDDNKDAGFEKPYRVGITLNTKLNPFNSGEWTRFPDGGKLWHLMISCKGAIALGIDYSAFSLPAGSDLFIYNANHTQLAGAYTSINNSGGHSFATRPLYGDEIILEYYQPMYCDVEPLIEISGINYMYRGMDVGIDRNSINFSGAGDCEVNVNCSEGDKWKSQAKGVVRILTRINGQSYWCTGSLVNNTNLDFSPYILTANHCASNGNISSTEDLNKWIFYFKYESPDCENPSSSPTIKSITGARKLASSENPSFMGSDFYLVKLNESIPVSYNPYFNGWRITPETSNSGVSIHHPQGDIKKISTYTNSLVTGSWETPSGTHWLVKWSETANGYGVTERGSSGSPIFDSEGLLIGTLTGGDSDCTSPGSRDYYGKFDFSWESNGSEDSMQLRPWLDPLNIGRTSLQGMSRLIRFEAEANSIPIGGTAIFHDSTIGQVITRQWHFEGGEPSVSTDQNPSGIRYNSFGKYAVSLVVKYLMGSDTLTDSLTKYDYIQVKALVYPNPASEKIYIFTNTQNGEAFKIELYTPFGSLVKSKEWPAGVYHFIEEVELPATGNCFVLRITRGSQVQVEKIIVVRSL